VTTIGKRYYPIVNNFDDVKGLELKGPLATVSAFKNKMPYDGITETEVLVQDEIQDKMAQDSRFENGNYMFKVKFSKWRWSEDAENMVGSFRMDCDVYQIIEREN
jgi:hypothetical protein